MIYQHAYSARGEAGGWPGAASSHGRGRQAGIRAQLSARSSNPNPRCLSASGRASCRETGGAGRGALYLGLSPESAPPAGPGRQARATTHPAAPAAPAQPCPAHMLIHWRPRLGRRGRISSLEPGAEGQPLSRKRAGPGRGRHVTRTPSHSIIILFHPPPPLPTPAAQTLMSH